MMAMMEMMMYVLRDILGVALWVGQVNDILGSLDAFAKYKKQPE